MNNTIQRLQRTVHIFDGFCWRWQKFQGEPSDDVLGNLSSKLNQLKKQIQTERVNLIKVSQILHLV